MTAARRAVRGANGLLAAWVLACAGPRQVMRPPSPQDGGFELALNNRHWLDVNVFVQHEGEVTRVAIVTASSSVTMLLPHWLLGDAGLVRIIAEPVGEGARYTTENLRVLPGQVVEVNVESQLSESNYSVR